MQEHILVPFPLSDPFQECLRGIPGSVQSARNLGAEKQERGVWEKSGARSFWEGIFQERPLLYFLYLGHHSWTGARRSTPERKGGSLVLICMLVGFAQ
jgi:hypothetical protein